MGSRIRQFDIAGNPVSNPESRSLLDALPIAALILDHRQRVIAVNPALLNLLGDPPAPLLGQKFGALVQDANAQRLAELLRSPDTYRIDLSLRFIYAGADTGKLQVTFVRFDNAQQQPRLLSLILESKRQPELNRSAARDDPQHDAAVNRRKVTTLCDTQRRLLQCAAVYAATSDGVLIADTGGFVVAVNPAFTRITGYSESEVLGRQPSLLNSHWHPRSYFIGMWRLLLRHGIWQGEMWNRRKDGEIYLQKLVIRRVLDARGSLVSFVSVFADCGNLSLRRVDRPIHYDALTKLPNRLLFESRLEHAIALGRRRAAPLALILFDLDHFSHLNTSLGHQLGDALLRAVAQRLRATIRLADTLARFRADQFILLFEGIERIADVEDIARRLQAALGREFCLCNHRLFVTASLGIVFDAGIGSDRNALLTHAESALRQAKRKGRNGFRIALAEHRLAAHEHQRLVERMRAGLDKGEYRLLYRPRVDLETDKQRSVEVLIRWDQREMGAIPPERFLPLANESGFMIELGGWALATACRQFQQWRLQGLPVAGFSINVSEAQLMRGNLLHTLERLLAENPQAVGRLDLEFSESLLQKHPEQLAGICEGLRRLGISLTLNDVGAGWTSPAVLQRLPLKTLKIHAALIESLPQSHTDLAVVQALIGIAQALDLDILADGVRTEAQRLLLLTIGCRQAQGALFGEPMLAARFAYALDPQPLPAPSGAHEN